MSTAVDVSDSAYRVAAPLLASLTGSRLMRPVQRRYDELAARGETVVEPWVGAGRRAEQRSRALARQAALYGEDEAIDQVIGVMGSKPEVRQLVTQQGMGCANQTVTALQDRSAVADMQWERRIRRLLRRS